MLDFIRRFFGFKKEKVEVRLNTVYDSNLEILKKAVRDNKVTALKDKTFDGKKGK